jgi:hypothetical protein
MLADAEDQLRASIDLAVGLDRDALRLRYAIFIATIAAFTEFGILLWRSL